MEKAVQFTGNTQTFILVERKEKNPQDVDHDPKFPFVYEPLLKNYEELFPDIRVSSSVNAHRRRERACSAQFVVGHCNAVELYVPQRAKCMR